MLVGREIKDGLRNSNDEKSIKGYYGVVLVTIVITTLVLHKIGFRDN